MRNKIIIYITLTILLLTCYSKNHAIMAEDVIKKDTLIDIIPNCFNQTEQFE